MGAHNSSFNSMFLFILLNSLGWKMRVFLIFFLIFFILIIIFKIVIHLHVRFGFQLIFQTHEIIYHHSIYLHFKYLRRGVLENLIFYRWWYLLFKLTCLNNKSMANYLVIWDLGFGWFAVFVLIFFYDWSKV